MVQILAVCTGNVCRSPIAERLLQAGLDATRPSMFHVRSAGIHALAGRAMDARAAGLLRVFGGDSEGFVAAHLTDEHLRDPSLVLAMSVEHRDRILSLAPRLLKRTFTVREMARVLRAVREDPALEIPRGSSAEDVEVRWQRLPHLLALKRYETRAEDPLDDDVVDPYRREDAVYQQMGRELRPAIEAIVEFEAAAGP
jgi:protein-tyrosine phosphatase